MSPAELLRTAAANITDETWCQNPPLDAFDCATPTCASGHLAIAAQRAAHTWGNAMAACGWALGSESVVDWNDTPGRTASDVRALFLRVADELEATR